MATAAVTMSARQVTEVPLPLRFSAEGELGDAEALDDVDEVHDPTVVDPLVGAHDRLQVVILGEQRGPGPPPPRLVRWLAVGVKPRATRFARQRQRQGR